MRVNLVDDERSLVRIGFNLNNTQISIFVVFGEDDTDAHIEGRDFVKIPNDQTEKACRICNQMNNNYRWIKFVWDDDTSEMTVKCDAVIQLDSVAEEIYELVMRTASIVDNAYPEIMKSLWA